MASLSAFLIITSSVAVVCTIGRPGVGLVNVGAGAKDGLALVWQVGDIGELMAVELEHCAERLLFFPLSVQAVLDIIDIHEKSIDLSLIIQGFGSIVLNFRGVQ